MTQFTKLNKSIFAILMLAGGSLLAMNNRPTLSKITIAQGIHNIKLNQKRLEVTGGIVNIGKTYNDITVSGGIVNILNVYFPALAKVIQKNNGIMSIGFNTTKHPETGELMINEKPLSKICAVKYDDEYWKYIDYTLSDAIYDSSYSKGQRVRMPGAVVMNEGSKVVKYIFNQQEYNNMVQQYKSKTELPSPTNKGELKTITISNGIHKIEDNKNPLTVEGGRVNITNNYKKITVSNNGIVNILKSNVSKDLKRTGNGILSIGFNTTKHPETGALMINGQPLSTKTTYDYSEEVLNYLRLLNDRCSYCINDGNKGRVKRVEMPGAFIDTEGKLVIFNQQEYNNMLQQYKSKTELPSPTNKGELETITISNGIHKIEDNKNPLTVKGGWVNITNNYSHITVSNDGIVNISGLNIADNLTRTGNGVLSIGLMTIKHPKTKKLKINGQCLSTITRILHNSDSVGAYERNLIKKAEKRVEMKNGSFVVLNKEGKLEYHIFG